jgi:hypothetical protein
MSAFRQNFRLAILSAAAVPQRQEESRKDSEKKTRQWPKPGGAASNSDRKDL